MASDTDPRFHRDKFLVNQKHLSIKEKYYIYDERDKELFFVERPFKFLGRRDITVFEDEPKKVPVLSINQDYYWELWNRNYTVVDGAGHTIAKLSRSNLASLFRRSWRIMDSKGRLVALAREDSPFLAFIRRVTDWIPLINMIGLLIKTDFHFVRRDDAGNECKIGTFTRRMTLADKYLLDLSEDPGHTLDRRTAVAVGILLDTGEKR